MGVFSNSWSVRPICWKENVFKALKKYFYTWCVAYTDCIYIYMFIGGVTDLYRKVWFAFERKCLSASMLLRFEV